MLDGNNAILGRDFTEEQWECIYTIFGWNYDKSLELAKKLCGEKYKIDTKIDNALNEMEIK
jgi:hypothetical protein